MALSAPAFAATPLELYETGDYAAAADAGEAEGSAAGLALAARALLSQGELADTPCLACLQRAESLAMRAATADPARVDASIYLAMALGFEARLVGTDVARRERYAERSKNALDAASRVAPDNPLVLAALGGWHIEVVRAGGRIGAAIAYGARVSDGLRLYGAAMLADPANIVIRYQYALTLAGYDLEHYRADIAEHLQQAIAQDARTAYERALQDRARRLSDALSRDATTADILIRRFQGYP